MTLPHSIVGQRAVLFPAPGRMRRRLPDPPHTSGPTGAQSPLGSRSQRRNGAACLLRLAAKAEPTGMRLVAGLVRPGQDLFWSTGCSNRRQRTDLGARRPTELLGVSCCGGFPSAPATADALIMRSVARNPEASAAAATCPGHPAY